MDNSLKLYIKLALAGFLLVSLSSCGKKKKASSRSTPLLEAYRLIDDDRSSEAIDLLEKSIRENPDDRKAKFTLVSAYAHKAGFKIQRLSALFLESEEFKELSQSFNVEERGGNSPRAVSEVESSFLKFAISLLKVTKILETLRRVPTIDLEQIVYLKHAISILDEMKPLTQSESLYQAILNTLLFKHIITYKLMPQGSFTYLDDNKCKLDVLKLNSVFMKSGNALIKALKNYAVAKPKETEKIKKSIESIEKMISDLTLLTSSTILIDEVAQEYLNETIVQNELGKSFGCKKENSEELQH